MNNTTDGQFTTNYDEIDPRELFYALWEMKFYIGAITSVFAFISILYALALPNIYQSNAILIPVEDDSRMSGMMAQYSGMASLAGISLPGETITKTKEAIARIESYEFFSNYILPNIKLENLFAVKQWDQLKNTITYKESIYKSDLNEWVRKVKAPKSKVPSSQEAYRNFKEVLNVYEDKNTLFVSISIEHESPIIAQRWVELITNQIDLVMRAKDKQQALKAVEYLNDLVPTIKLEEIKKVISSLQQEQLKRLMMLEASESYIFKYLELPIVPEMKSNPKRSLIVIIGTILGLVFSAIGSLFFVHTRKKFQKN